MTHPDQWAEWAVAYDHTDQALLLQRLGSSVRLYRIEEVDDDPFGTFRLVEQVPPFLIVTTAPPCEAL